MIKTGVLVTASPLCFCCVACPVSWPTCMSVSSCCIIEVGNSVLFTVLCLTSINPDIELLAVSLRPFYLPREFPQLFFILVYIHPKANASAATEHIKNTLVNWKPYPQTPPNSSWVISTTAQLTNHSKDFTSTSTVPPGWGRLWTSAMAPFCLQSSLQPSFRKCWPPYYLACSYLLNCGKEDRSARSSNSGLQWTVLLSCRGALNQLTGGPWQPLPQTSANRWWQFQDKFPSAWIILFPRKHTIFPNNKPWVTKDLKEILNKKKRTFFTGSETEKKDKKWPNWNTKAKWSSPSLTGAYAQRGRA